jgi:uncharacterized membrane protein
MATRDSTEETTRSKGTQRALIGAGLAAAAGTAAFLLVRRTADQRHEGEISDAPDHVWLRRTSRGKDARVGKTVTVNKPRQELYERWRDFTRFPDFMENVRDVRALEGGRSRWLIDAPAGTTVELVTRITEDRPGELIAWESEPDSQIETEGRVEFIEGPADRGTMVRLTMRYEPPAGLPGRIIAKLLQKEPSIQARRDLRRFKQLMETGEVTTNAGPSGRDDPVNEPKI